LEEKVMGMIQQLEIAVVVAIGKNRAIGKENKLLWHIKEDLQRFKRLTMGYPIIMGRKTFESIGKPLPGRTNIIVTRDKDWQREGATTAHSFEEALEIAKKLDGEKIFIGGGSQIYEQALPFVTKLYLTLIDDDKEADSYFPPYEHLFTKKVFEEQHRAPDGLRYSWVDLERA
jgi:dihydrofolate reductase